VEAACSGSFMLTVVASVADKVVFCMASPPSFGESRKRDPSSFCVVDRASHRLIGAASALYGTLCCQGRRPAESLPAGFWFSRTSKLFH